MAGKEIEAGDHIGRFQVVEVAENFWGAGETAVFLVEEDEIHECEREWVVKVVKAKLPTDEEGRTLYCPDCGSPSQYGYPREVLEG